MTDNKIVFLNSNNQYTMDPVYEEARRRVKKKKNFYKELVSFVSTSALLIFINVFSSPWYLWCLWAIVPWGITLTIKGLKLAAGDSTNGWEKEQMKKELRAMGKDPSHYYDDTLELDELEPEMRSSGRFNKSDFV